MIHAPDLEIHSAGDLHAKFHPLQNGCRKATKKKKNATKLDRGQPTSTNHAQLTTPPGLSAATTVAALHHATAPREYMATQLERDKHARYLLHCLREVPQPYAALDTSRLSLAYFCVAGLDVLAQLGKIDAPLRAGIVEWIYSLQVLPPSDGCAGLPADRLGGFRGSGYLGAAHSSGGAPSSSPYDGAHLAMTYTALAVLLTLGDDLSRVDQPRVLAFVSSLQDEAGCFSAYPGGERDMRFLFCAAAVVAMLRGGAVRTESSGCEPFPDPSRTFLGPFLQVPSHRAAASTSSGRSARTKPTTIARWPRCERGKAPRPSTSASRARCREG